MSEAGKAVFLSYASQDAAAAKRICDALRAAGVEVWFDQNELVGGDVWDAKIRRQIAECALFVPIISANTQARLEGYFRIEWKLAAQRTHAMAEEKAFLLPVVLDDTRDAEAKVPGEFKAVQWSRIGSDEALGAFCVRIQKLLGGAPVEAERSHPAMRAGGTPPTPKSSRGWLIPALGIIGVVIALGFWRPWQQAGSAAAVTPPAAAPATVVSEARKLANQAMQLLEDPNLTRESSWLADDLCDRALKRDAGDAEIWATAAFASINLYWNGYDASAGRREKMNSQATRASQLDPNSVRAALATALCLDLNYEKEEQRQALRELHRRAPEDQYVIFHLCRSEGQQRNEAAVQELLRKQRALPRTGLLFLTQWFEVLRLREAARFAEAEVIIDEMLSRSGQLRGANYEKLQLLMGSWHDLAAVEPFLERIPARYRQEPAFGSDIAQFRLWRNQPEKALQALAQVPQDYFEEFYASEPKAYHTGRAHALAGRPAAAQAEWRTALALVEERLKTDSRNFSLLEQRCVLLALTGQAKAARDSWQLRVELGGAQDRTDFRREAEMLLVLGEPERAVAVIEKAWSTLTPGQVARALPRLRHHPAFAAVREDPRMQRLFAAGTALLQRLKAEQTGGATKAKADLSVAVLAFANLSDDKEAEFFSDGISEELINALGRVAGLTVKGRTSAFFFKGKQVKSEEIGQQLGVTYLVRGSVRRAGGKVRITAQLSRAATDELMWSSESMERELKDVFAVQDEIVGLIAKNLSVSLGVAARAPHQVNPEALTALMEGRHYWVLRTTEGFARARELFTRAVALDPQWAPARAALANLLTIEASFLKGGGGSFAELIAAGAREARKAIELDASLGEPHAALGKIAMEEGRLAEAEQEFRRALALEPNNALVRDWYGDLAVTQGRLDVAIAEYRRALELEPLSPYIQWDLAWELMHVRRYGEALTLVERATALTPNGSARLALRRVRLLLELGRPAEAEARTALHHYLEGRRTGSDPQFANEAVYCLRALASPAEREQRTADLLRLYPDSFASGVILLMQGQEEKAYPLLEKTPAIFWQQLYWDPVFDAVRNTARFQQLLEKLGCAAEYKVARATQARLLQEDKTAR